MSFLFRKACWRSCALIAVALSAENCTSSSPPSACLNPQPHPPWCSETGGDDGGLAPVQVPGGSSGASVSGGGSSSGQSSGSSGSGSSGSGGFPGGSSDSGPSSSGGASDAGVGATSDAASPFDAGTLDADAGAEDDASSDGDGAIGKDGPTEAHAPGSDASESGTARDADNEGSE
jgi:hypothetical protein